MCLVGFCKIVNIRVESGEIIISNLKRARGFIILLKSRFTLKIKFRDCCKTMSLLA